MESRDTGDIQDKAAKLFKTTAIVPFIDMLVDYTYNNELLSFMNGFSCYNQI